eukprot:SAG11_NODE_1690_length_4443_cov_3.349908_1_plen_185_part_00
MTRQYAAKHFNKKVREQAALLVPGSYAWLNSEGITMPWDKGRKSTKLKAKFYGPFKILEQIGPVTYRLQIPNESRIHDVFHVALLKPVMNSDPSAIPVEQFPTVDSGVEYEVKTIIAQREKDGETQYLVKWKGYMYEDLTWEPEENLTNCQSAMAQFKRRSLGTERHATVETLEHHVQTDLISP